MSKHYHAYSRSEFIADRRRNIPVVRVLCGAEGVDISDAIFPTDFVRRVAKLRHLRKCPKCLEVAQAHIVVMEARHGDKISEFAQSVWYSPHDWDDDG